MRRRGACILLALALQRYPDLCSIKDLGSLVTSPWRRKFFILLGEPRHLDWIEHEHLRKRYRDWRIHDKPVVSYGHDLETTWLLLAAQDALGDTNEVVRQVALGLGKHSADHGYDSAKGGYFEEGVPGGAPTKLEKVFWIQAEALPGLW